MYLIVGLGNPSGKYEHTRHNAGFDCIDILAEKLSVKIRRSMHQAHFGKCKLGDKKLILAKPQTYMNLSGHAVQNIMHFYKIEPSKLIVIYDDTDLEPGRIRIRKKGSAGGHNGMKDIIRMIGTQDFVRIRNMVNQISMAADAMNLWIEQSIAAGNVSREELDAVSEELKRK